MHAEYLYSSAANHYSYLSQQASCSEYNVLVMQRLHARPTRLSSTVLSLRSRLRNNIFPLSPFILSYSSPPPPHFPYSRANIVLLKDTLQKGRSFVDRNPRLRFSFATKPG